jgi:RNA polymerase sigma-70 factor (ECF subfamily)
METHPSQDPSDAQLVERIRQHDVEALDELMDRYLDDVVGIAFHYTQTSDWASDVAQDVFINVWERRKSLDPLGNIAHYLRRAARNAALNALRHEAAVSRLQQIAAQEWTIVHPHLDNHGLRNVEVEEFNARVRTILATLSPRVQEVALLYHQRGLEPAEIASLLGVAPQTVYNQLRMAMQALSRAFREEGRE